MFDTKVTGMDKLIARSRGLSNAVRIRIARNGVMAGARVIRDKARQNAVAIDDPETGRSIANNVATRYRTKLSKQTGDPTASVGVLYPKARIPKGNPDDGRETPHWHLVELGTEHARAQPFLSPAAVQAAPRVPDAIATNMSKGIDRELKKL